jgi:excisionase family DNA binding protein
MNPTGKVFQMNTQRYFPPGSTPDLVAMPEFCERVGVSKWSFLRAVKNADLPFRKYGKQWKVNRAAFERWLRGEAIYD